MFRTVTINEPALGIFHRMAGQTAKIFLFSSEIGFDISCILSPLEKKKNISKFCLLKLNFCLFVLRFYGPVNPMGSFRAWSVYLTTRILGRLSPLSG